MSHDLFAVARCGDRVDIKEAGEVLLWGLVVSFVDGGDPVLMDVVGLFSVVDTAYSLCASWVVLGGSECDVVGSVTF